MTDDKRLPCVSCWRKARMRACLREMIGFAAQRLMELEIGGMTAGRAWRAQSRAPDAAQRLPRPGLGDPRRDRRAPHPQAAARQLLPGLPRAQAHGREGADGGDSGGLHPWRLDPLGRRPGAGDGHPASARARWRGSAARSTSGCNAFLSRPIEGEWPYLWLDATYVKVRQAGRIVSVAVTIAVAVNTDGRREVLGMAIGASEAETFWTDFLRSLARRGLRGVKLVISDSSRGPQGSRCPRAARLLAALPRPLHAQRAGPCRQERIAASCRPGSAPLRPGRCRRRAQAMAQCGRPAPPRVPKLAALMDTAEADVLAFMTFPKEHRAKIHSTNPLERGQRGDQAAHGRPRHLPERSRGHTAGRRHPARTERRMGGTAPLHEPETLAPISDMPTSVCPPWQSDSGSAPLRNEWRSYTTSGDVTMSIGLRDWAHGFLEISESRYQ